MATDGPRCGCCDRRRADIPGDDGIGEVCLACAPGNDPFAVDVEEAGGWMVQDGHGRPT